MEDHLEMMLLSNLLHDDHQHHVLVDRLCRIAVYRRTLELVRCHLVMSCLEHDAELICLGLEILHETAYT